LRFY